MYAFVTAAVSVQESVKANIPVHEMLHEKFLLKACEWEKTHREMNPNFHV